MEVNINYKNKDLYRTMTKIIILFQLKFSTVFFISMARTTDFSLQKGNVIVFNQYYHISLSASIA